MLTIQDHEIGVGAPCFIIAEAGVNHNGDVDFAHQLIDAAADAGADAVKFQTFDPTALTAPEARKAAYQVETTGAAGSQLEMLQGLVLASEVYPPLMRHAEQRGLVFLSTPFDEGSADFLDRLGLAAFKVSSGDLTTLPFLRFLAAKNKPLLVSTGMATLGEVMAAVSTIRQADEDFPLALFHCVSNYPAEPADCNLLAMHTLAQTFRCAVGWSDHTQDIHISLAAVALGAVLLEKHFTLDRTLPGPDHRASLEPDELRRMVAAIRDVEKARGDGLKRPVAAEAATATAARRSLYWAQSLEPGEIAQPESFALLRPGTGISPAERDLLTGRRVGRAVVAGQMVSREDF